MTRSERQNFDSLGSSAVCCLTAAESLAVWHHASLSSWPVYFCRLTTGSKSTNLNSKLTTNCYTPWH